jgi:hypothetical protein
MKVCSLKECNTLIALIESRLGPLKSKACKGPLQDIEYAYIKAYTEIAEDMKLARSLAEKRSQITLQEGIKSVELMKKRVQ